jgi:hypothetical protein
MELRKNVNGLQKISMVLRLVFRQNRPPEPGKKFPAGERWKVSVNHRDPNVVPQVASAS